MHVSKEQSVAGVTEQRAGHLQMRKRDFRKVLLLFFAGGMLPVDADTSKAA